MAFLGVLRWPSLSITNCCGLPFMNLTGYESYRVLDSILTQCFILERNQLRCRLA